MEDKIFFDRRAELARLPGLHAFVVGVSNYNLPTEEHLLQRHHLGMLRLNTAALTAYRLGEWLVDRKDSLAVPLASCRMLISPTAAERKREPALRGVKAQATLRRFRMAAERWREEACTNPENVALFYFAGHGIQRLRQDHVILLEEFGKKASRVLEYGIATTELINGMARAHARNVVAERQIYFIDACRNVPLGLNDIQEPKDAGLWDVGKLVPDDNLRASYFFATGEGLPAFELPDGSTVFGAALLDCLKGGAAVYDPRTRKWCVTLGSLRDGLHRHIQALNRRYRINQNFRAVEVFGDLPLHYQEDPPITKIDLALDPLEGGKYAHVSVKSRTNELIWHLSPPDSMAASKQLPTGTYIVEARVDPPTDPYLSFHDLLEAILPETDWTIPLIRPKAP
jgi:Caspase domain